MKLFLYVATACLIALTALWGLTPPGVALVVTAVASGLLLLSLLFGFATGTAIWHRARTPVGSSLAEFAKQIDECEATVRDEWDRMDLLVVELRDATGEDALALIELIGLCTERIVHAQTTRRSLLADADRLVGL